VRVYHYIGEITVPRSASFGDREFRTPPNQKGAAECRNIARISLALMANSKTQFRSNARMTQ
jgi:hypothetical protein